MEYLGVIAFIIVLGYSSLPNQIKKLDKEIKKIKNNSKGDNIMSKLISDLKGHECVIECKEGLLDGKTSIECKVLDVDDEWMKISFTTKKGQSKLKVIRIDTIENIEMK
ncbi:hypothetical protein GC105_14130 [Alkalibaculum sp. M08DMB]|uniref:Uncharacterized protein n=1 Tax=Alkalibaculum sporogenes TaxID=2655001 RepID=A0A6A7KBJ0_9FIRM|nr:hypothetical protein [Alkalibaculum sporogenes]MPW26920.1 hypothetical protein [Alkalibaculum sporogenes]